MIFDLKIIQLLAIEEILDSKLIVNYIYLFIICNFLVLHVYVNWNSQE